MRPIQFLLLSFVLFALTRVFQKYKQRSMRWGEFYFWFLVWIGTGIIISFPDSTSFLAGFLGIGRGADLILYSSLLIAFYLIFQIHLALDRIEQEITEVVRAIALGKLEERPRDPRATG